MAALKLVCPCCGYPVTGDQTVRCPRCNHVLQLPQSCPGKCSECTKKRKIGAGKKNTDKKAKAARDRGPR